MAGTLGEHGRRCVARCWPWRSAGDLLHEDDRLGAGHIDAGRHEGWSVVLRSIAGEVTGALEDTSVRERAIQLSTWVTGQKGHWMRLTAPRLSGRRLRAP